MCSVRRSQHRRSPISRVSACEVELAIDDCTRCTAVNARTSPHTLLPESFKAIVAILDSAEWQLTISSFLRAECVIFDGSDPQEPHFECFERFRQAVDKLLAGGLKERGVSLQELAHLCCLASLSKLGQHVLEQLLVVEDYTMFAAMMLRCNRRQHARAKETAAACGSDETVEAAELKLNPGLNQAEDLTLLSLELARIGWNAEAPPGARNGPGPSGLGEDSGGGVGIRIQLINLPELVRSGLSAMTRRTRQLPPCLLSGSERAIRGLSARRGSGE